MLRLSDEDHKALINAAYDARMSAAQFVREAIELKKTTSEAPLPGYEATKSALRLLVNTVQKLYDDAARVSPEPGPETAAEEADHG